MSKPSLLVVLCIASVAAAQPVYETSDRDGPVFSHIPSTGAREIPLPQINLMDSPSTPAAAQPAPAMAPYTAVQIIQPENGGTVHSNTGLFSMAVALSPDLRTERGDAIAIKLDGRVLPITLASASAVILTSLLGFKLFLHIWLKKLEQQ